MSLTGQHVYWYYQLHSNGDVYLPRQPHPKTFQTRYQRNESYSYLKSNQLRRIEQTSSKSG